MTTRHCCDTSSVARGEDDLPAGNARKLAEARTWVRPVVDGQHGERGVERIVGEGQGL